MGVSNAELREKYLDSGNHGWRCALCHIPERRLKEIWPPHLDMAHIVSRGIAGKRGQVLENVLLLCSRCHIQGEHRGELPDITRALLVRLKKDLGELDVDVLSRVWGRTAEYVLECAATEIPETYLSMRQRWKC